MPTADGLEVAAVLEPVLLESLPPTLSAGALAECHLIEPDAVGVAVAEEHRHFGGLELLGPEIVRFRLGRDDAFDEIRKFLGRRAQFLVLGFDGVVFECSRRELRERIEQLGRVDCVQLARREESQAIRPAPRYNGIHAPPFLSRKPVLNLAGVGRQRQPTRELTIMPRPIDPARDLLFGLLALQTGLINQAQLMAAFHGWTQA
jgi:hypothetical protein